MNDKQSDKQQLEKENAELKAQFKILSDLNPALYDNSDEIDLKELWNAIWSGKWIIVIVTSIFAVASVFHALSLPDEYKATTILAPASKSNGGGLSQLAGQFGGLASLAGINLSGGGRNKSDIAVEVLKTWGFLEKFIIDNNIQIEVFAAKGWSKRENKLIIDEQVYDEANSKWIKNSSSKNEDKAEPSSWKLFEEISGRINISLDKRSGLVSLSVEHYSPFIAKAWVDKLVLSINKHIQEQDRLEAERSIKYLKEKINETTVANMQSVFYQLIEEQTKTLMLAEVSDEYVFKTVSRAMIPERKSKPKRALICVLGILLGGILSILIVFIRHFFNLSKSE